MATHLKNILTITDKNQVCKKPVFKEARFQVMVLHLPQGEELKPHISTTDATMMVMAGEALFNIDDKEFHLSTNDLFSFEANKKHAVQALTDFTAIIVK